MKLISLVAIILMSISYNFDEAHDNVLTVRGFKSELLNETIFQLVNQKRIKKGLKALDYDASLNEVCRDYQDEFEFKNFRNSGSIERKIARKVHLKTKKAGFKGKLILPVVGQSEALNYNKKKEFHLNLNNHESEFHLYYGKKPRKSEQNPDREPIKAFNYYAFAKNLLNEMDSEHKKQLYKKHYKWGGIHTQWYYKSLNKRRIPKIKMIFLLGGYATAGMR